MALPAIGDGEQIGDGNTNETLNVGRSGQSLQLGGTAATLIGFHGATPVSRAAYVSNLSVAASASVGGVGFATTASLSNFMDAVNSILTCLRNKGLMASS